MTSVILHNSLLIQGKYLTGSLRVSRYHPREEAYVTPLEVLTSSHLDILEQTSVSDILIPGTAMRWVDLIIDVRVNYYDSMLTYVHY